MRGARISTFFFLGTPLPIDLVDTPFASVATPYIFKASSVSKKKSRKKKITLCREFLVHHCH